MSPSEYAGGRQPGQGGGGGSPRSSSIGVRILALWRRLEGLPLGKRIFSRLLGRMVPYSGTIRPRILSLEPGKVRAEMADRRRVRNHLDSIHAIALANLGELVTGLATVTALPDNGRGILVELRVDYRRKARGRVVAECTTEPPVRLEEPVDHRVRANVVDEAGEVVATIEASWRLAPTR